MRGRTQLARCTVAAALVLTACGDQTSGQPLPTLDPDHFARVVSADSLWSHLAQLQEIADAHNGNRASGTRGYDASADYVGGLLAERGFDVREHAHEYQNTRVTAAAVTSDGDDIETGPIQSTRATDDDGLTGVVVPLPRSTANRTLGCTAADYDGVDVRDHIVLVDRGDCTFAEKEQLANDRGALALLVVNNADGLTRADHGDEEPPLLPMVLITRADGERFRAEPRPATIQVDAIQTITKSKSVVAETRTGGDAEVVLVSAHLDSVPDGPGINDNGSGTAAVLETALKLGPEPPVDHAVRFVFFGSEEPGLIGSRRYVDSLSAAELEAIAVVLNIDMVGSPNAGYFVYDPAAPDSLPVPRDSAKVTAAFADFFRSRGIEIEPIAFDGRSDYAPFVASGVPAGGIFTGDIARKTADQSQRWGGRPNEPFDPNYHQSGDDLANIDRTALLRNTQALAYVVMRYAQAEEVP